MSSQPITWLITGASSGFGLSLSSNALQAGHFVFATVRRRTGERYAEAVKTIEDAGGKCIQLDVSSLDALPSVVHGVLDGGKGKIDVLANNAGYSLLGAVEDINLEEAKHQMDTNFFAPLRLIQLVLPQMRARRSGTIVNASSVAGLYALPSCGLYSASKFALEGVSESLRSELAPFNIDVLIVEPGAFRTNFLNSGVYAGKQITEAYASNDHPISKTFERLKRYRENKPSGDTDKGARVIYDAIVGDAGSEECREAAALKGKVQRVLLGKDAIKRMEMKIETLQGDLDKMRAVASSTDADDAISYI
ncbi:hypothetical protein MPH_07231 [Macrophomina phaseolina MS6]|uniref:Short-chain dehydrogenase/reductase SDR n=1 Tax=Macrophomina phaseolina (strain MS6) TaxID=1126212 RepID=K2SFJ0_MACPH|nr:hypothetical protein MPH_07231 [Macrophomina phaseolina MS6]